MKHIEDIFQNCSNYYPVNAIVAYVQIIAQRSEGFCQSRSPPFFRFLCHFIYYWLPDFSFCHGSLWSNMFSSLDQPLHFSYTCTVNKPFPGFQFYQRQYYPTDYVTREYLPYPNCKSSSNVSPSSNGKMWATKFF